MVAIIALPLSAFAFRRGLMLLRVIPGAFRPCGAEFDAPPVSMWRRFRSVAPVPAVDVSQQNHWHFVKAGLRSPLYPTHDDLRDRIPNFILRENTFINERPEELG